MKPSDMSPNFLRAMHRAPALRQPVQPSEKLTRALKSLLEHDNPTRTPVPNPKPQCDEAPALGAATQGEAQSLPRTTVRFVGYRVRPLDPDNFAGSVKDLLDGCRHASLIPGDEPWRIRLETEQVKVGSFKEEKTVIVIEYPEP